MKTARRNNVIIESGAGKPATQAIITLLLTMADTTWRIFVPGILFAGLGVWADVSFGSKPWLTLAGLVVGLVVGALLIKIQIKNVQR